MELTCLGKPVSLADPEWMPEDLRLVQGPEFVRVEHRESDWFFWMPVGTRYWNP